MEKIGYHEGMEAKSHARIRRAKLRKFTEKEKPHSAGNRALCSSIQRGAAGAKFSATAVEDSFALRFLTPQ
jgi:hypothetical protein